jgi:glycosyltransferase involved in cell wall biosynthesis
LFKWLIIDDGSTDNTRVIVDHWIKDNLIEIEYIYKENGGLHTGYNTAIEHLDTELSVCIDSDDWLADNAIELILKLWDAHKADDLAGIVGLDVKTDGSVIGSRLKTGERIYPLDLKTSKNKGADKKYVIRTDCYKTVAPMPVFSGEKNFNPHYMVLKLSQKYRFLALDEPLCVVDYQPDGMAANLYKQYLNSPKSFAEYRRAVMQLKPIPFTYLIRTVIHYCSSSQLSHNKNYIKESPKPLLTVLCTPTGWLLTALIKRKTKRMA